MIRPCPPGRAGIIVLPKKPLVLLVLIAGRRIRTTHQKIRQSNSYGFYPAVSVFSEKLFLA